MDITTVGIDLAKNIFQIHGVDSKGKALLKKKLSRQQLPEFVANLPACKIVMEACGGANYWARKLIGYGHEVKLISPQFVKPFVKGHKNDRNDAEAIVEAASRPSMRYVSPKTVEEQDMQSILRLRHACLQMRTKFSNQLRGLLSEYGIVMTQGLSHLHKKLSALLNSSEEAEELSIFLKEALKIQYDLLLKVEEKIVDYDKKIISIANTDASCQQIQEIEGIGPITAIAIVAVMGNPNAFKNGRHFAAFLGLVPRQNSSGGRNKLLGITKHGEGRAGTNRTCVAVANKNARIVWALLKHGEDYRRAI